MQPGENNSNPAAKSQPEKPPVIEVPPLLPNSPAPSLQKIKGQARWEHTLAILLSLCLLTFLAEAFISFTDDSLILFLDAHALTGLRGTLFFLAILMAGVLYVLMALTPMIPKRLFLPLALFNPITTLVFIPFMIFFFDRMQAVAWVTSCCQLLFALAILYAVRGGFNFKWPIVAEEKFNGPRFTWRNLFTFLVVNILIVLPVVAVYLTFNAALAVNHFTEGFLTLQSKGLTVQVRKYVRNDGKTIQLFPMSHIGDSEFYRQLSESFPTNALILMEGVSDDHNLLTNKITYTRVATSLGLAEQQKEFKPRGIMMRADVDVSEFTTNTIALLNTVMLVHTKGLNAATLLSLSQYSPPPHYEKVLFGDLLAKRNQHLLKEIKASLPNSDTIIVPWGVAHMPELAREIQKFGFRLQETEEHVAIRFGSEKNKSGLEPQK